MAKSSYYHQLSLGELFLWGTPSKIYRKVKPVMKTCCKQLYNTVGVTILEDGSLQDSEVDKIIVPGNVSVQVYDHPGAPPGAT